MRGRNLGPLASSPAAPPSGVFPPTDSAIDPDFSLPAGLAILGARCQAHAYSRAPNHDGVLDSTLRLGPHHVGRRGLERAACRQSPDESNHALGSRSNGCPALADVAIPGRKLVASQHLRNAAALPSSPPCLKTCVRLVAHCRWALDYLLNRSMDRVDAAREGSWQPSSRFLAVPDFHSRACDRNGVSGCLRRRGSWLSWILAGQLGIEGWWSSRNPGDGLGDGTWPWPDTRIRVAHDALLFAC